MPPADSQTPLEAPQPAKPMITLTRDQRDALCAANSFLTILQTILGEETFSSHRVQKPINVISDMLYGDK